MNETIHIAVIGCGQRAKYVIGHLLDDSRRMVKVTAVFDPDAEVIEDTLQFWQQPDALRCNSYAEAINAPGVEWVLVFSPNIFHKEQIIAAFEAGKDVFSEKPLATDINDCIAINESHRKSGKYFATGFVLRYAPIYRKAHEIITSGVLGKLLTIEANENIPPEHGSYIMCNWRRKTAISGPHILEKCCHDLDLLEWFTNSIPVRVTAFGGKDFYLPENQELDCHIAPKRKLWNDYHPLPDPFTGDGDLMDNLVSIAEFRNRIRVSFSYSMSNPLPERRMYFAGSKGNMRLDLYSSELSWKTLEDPTLHTLNFGSDGHGGGDDFIMKELYHTMITGTPPKCSGEEGLLSAVYALAVDESARTGRIIDLEPVWKKLGK